MTKLLLLPMTFALLLAAAPVAKAQDITTGLVGHWKMDDAAGPTVTDSSGNGYDGTASGGVTYAQGGVDALAAEFDGTNGTEIDIGDIAALEPASFTISAWMKGRMGTRDSTVPAIISKGNGDTAGRGYALYWRSNGNNRHLQFRLDGAGNLDSPDNTILSNTWYHVAASYDGSVIRLYIDGAEVAARNDPGLNPSSSNRFNIGDRSTNPEPFKGLIDDVRIYDRALTPEDVQALYQEHICSDPKGFQGQMLFDADTAVMEYCNGDQWVAMSPARTGWKYVAGGWSPTTCGVRNDGTAWCWGRGSGGELGNGTTTAIQSTPVQVQTNTGPDGWSDWSRITVSKGTACGLRSNGTAWCWGTDNRSQLGCGGCGDQTRPVQVQTDTGPGGWSDWTRIEGGGQHHICGLRADRTAWCWGNGLKGALGDGDTAHNSRPGQVQTDTGPGGWSDWVDIAAALGASCGIRADGTAWCWGNGGGLGNGDDTFQDQSRPVQIVDAAGTGHWSDWVDIDRNSSAGCGIRDDGTAWCWGSSMYGKLGIGPTSDSTSTPVQVQTDTGPDHWSDWVAIFAGESNAGDGTFCGIRSDRSLWCWGAGYGDRPERILADDGSIAWDDWVSVGVGWGTECGIRSDRSLWCWGQGADGELGNGATVNEPNPVHVLSPSPADYTRGTDSGLVAHWKLDGDARDSRGMHDAVITGGDVTYEDGPVGTAIKLSDDPILLDVDTLDDADVFRDEFTITGWFKPQDFSNIRDIIGNESAITAQKGFVIRTNQTGDFFITVNDGASYTTATASAPFQIDKWYFFSARIRSSDISLHVGDEDGTITTETVAYSEVLDFSPSNDFFGIGRLDNTSWDTYGSLDDIRIYNRALSEAEIEALYNLRNPGLSRGLVGYWTFDDIDGTTVPDNSGNGNDGTMTDFNDPAAAIGHGLLGAGIDFGANTGEDYINLGNDASLNSQIITVSAWGKDCAGSGSRSLVTDQGSNQPDGYLLRCDDNGRIAVSLGGTWNVVDVTVGSANPSGWNHYAFSYDGAEVVAYYNGVAVGTQAFSDAMALSGNTTKIGRRTSLEDNYNSVIDDVRIYNRALSPSEISMLYKMGRTANACADPDGKLGDLYYNTSFEVMQYCNGAEWVPMGPVPGTGGGGCAGPPVGVRGDLYYNTDYDVMQYCDGASWRRIGK